MKQRKNTLRKKAQLFSIDSIIAMSLFIAIFISLTFVWDRAINNYTYLEERDDLERISRNSLGILLSNPGVPQDWHLIDDQESIESIGILTKSQGKINRQKLLALDEKYEQAKILSGFRGPGYELRIDIEEYDTSLRSVSNWSIGYEGSCDMVVRINRIASFDDNGHYATIIFKGCKRE